MSTPSDGGPAFPTSYELGSTRDSGLSIRDWFAGQALLGILGSRSGFLVDVGTENAPGWAYQVADGMLRERARPVDDESECESAQPAGAGTGGGK